MAYLTKTYLQNLKYNIKRGCIFHSILVGVPFVLILSVQNREGGRLLNRQNPLSVTKVICWQSLNQRCYEIKFENFVKDKIAFLLSATLLFFLEQKYILFSEIYLFMIPKSLITLAFFLPRQILKKHLPR